MAPTIRGLGAVQPHVKAVAEQIATIFGITNIGGFASSGHITNSDHYRGLALDVMTGPNPNEGKGALVAGWTLQNAEALAVKYVIWNRQYNGVDGKGWTKYTGSSPHTDHVHISFHATPGSGNVSGEGAASAPAGSDDLMGCITAIFG